MDAYIGFLKKTSEAYGSSSDVFRFSSTHSYDSHLTLYNCVLLNHSSHTYIQPYFHF